MINPAVYVAYNKYDVNDAVFTEYPPALQYLLGNPGGKISVWSGNNPLTKEGVLYGCKCRICGDTGIATEETPSWCCAKENCCLLLAHRQAMERAGGYRDIAAMNAILEKG